MLSLVCFAALAQPSSHPFTRAAVGESLPHGYDRPSPLRAAYSHCSSVGTFFPAQRQYEAASSNVMQFIGCSSRAGLPSLQNALHVALSSFVIEGQSTVVRSPLHAFFSAQSR